MNLQQSSKPKYERIIPTDNYPFKIFTFKTNDPNRLIPPHWHESAELLFCLSGELDVFLLDRYHQLKENDFIFINSNIVHASRTPVTGECLAIQFPLQFLEDATDQQYLKSFLFDVDPTKRSDEIEIILLWISKNYTNESIANHLLVKGKIFEILASFCEVNTHVIANISEIKSMKYLKIMREVNDYIVENAWKNLSIKDVANQFNYNPSYFSRFYKNFMGITFTDYLNSIRLEAVYKQLRETDYTITEIALNNGFSTVKSMYNVFKKVYKISPKQYKQKYFKK